MYYCPYLRRSYIHIQLLFVIHIDVTQQIISGSSTLRLWILCPRPTHRRQEGAARTQGRPPRQRIVLLQGGWRYSAGRGVRRRTPHRFQRRREEAGTRSPPWTLRTRWPRGLGRCRKPRGHDTFRISLLGTKSGLMGQIALYIINTSQ